MKREKFIDLKKIKKHLRLFKNELDDYFKLTQYQLNSIKLKLSNFTLFNNNKEIGLHGKKNISKDHTKIAFVVTECDDNSSAGDYFTAMELGEALKTYGWEITFLPRKGSGYWYAVDENVDVVISLLDSYDPRKIKTSNKSLIKIAWLRNWFDRWVSNPGFSEYNIIFANSNIACNYVKGETNKECYLLPIATNTSRFNNKISPRKEYESDYCFTGSYWDDPRDIIEMLDPESLRYNFKLYGKNWNKINKFKKYYQGFIDYSKIPEVYASTKIVIDDANRVTKDYGAVNSRVFDAIASNALVITNGEKGAKETFKGKLPYFTSKEELNNLIEYYLNNEKERIEKIKELNEFVLKNHTYHNRAYIIKKRLENYRLSSKF